VLVVLTHDVDYSIKGPGVDHILKRRDRFEEWVIRRVLEEGFNPYFGIPKIVEIEEEVGVRSTFFFRAYYDDNETVEGYAHVIRDLVRGGWSVGLHFNDPNNIAEEKALIEKLGVKIEGTRGHYLRVPDFTLLKRLDIKFDSSIAFSKGGCDERNSGFMRIEGILEFPVTFMDAYMFAYDRLSEEEVVPFVIRCIRHLAERGAKLVTLLWHDNSIYMKGGRVYPQLLRELSRKHELIDMASAYARINNEERL